MKERLKTRYKKKRLHTLICHNVYTLVTGSSVIQWSAPNSKKVMGLILVWGLFCLEFACSHCASVGWPQLLWLIRGNVLQTAQPRKHRNNAIPDHKHRPQHRKMHGTKICTLGSFCSGAREDGLLSVCVDPAKKQ